MPDRNRAPSGSRRAGVPPPSDVSKLETRVFRIEQEKDTGLELHNTIITGGLIRTAVEGARVEVSSPQYSGITFPMVFLDTGQFAGTSHTGASLQGTAILSGGEVYSALYIIAPYYTSGPSRASASISLNATSSGGTSKDNVVLKATTVVIDVNGTTTRDSVYFRKGPFAGASTQLAMFSPAFTGSGAIKVQDGEADRIHIANTGDSAYIACKALKFETSPGPFWSSGSGSPEGVVTAPVGSLYTRTDGSTGSSLYVKESGSGNTGWNSK